VIGILIQETLENGHLNFFKRYMSFCTCLC